MESIEDLNDKGAPKLLLDFYAQLCGGNAAAHEFVCLWHLYCHEIDDLIDNKETDPEAILRVFMHAAQVFSTPFYRQHVDRLLPLVATVTSMYADSVRWEFKEEPLWKRQAADTLRHAGNEMLFAVAFIVGGYDQVRRHSAALRAMCWVNHHDEYGDPK